MISDHSSIENAYGDSPPPPSIRGNRQGSVRILSIYLQINSILVPSVGPNCHLERILSPEGATKSAQGHSREELDPCGSQNGFTRVHIGTPGRSSRLCRTDFGSRGSQKEATWAVQGGPAEGSESLKIKGWKDSWSKKRTLSTEGGGGPEPFGREILEGI